MAEDNDFSDVIGRGVAFLALIIFGPIVFIIVLGRIFDALAPLLPLLLTVALVGGAAYAFHKYQTAPFTLRARHADDVLALLARAEAQQRALPQTIDAAILSALATKGLDLDDTSEIVAVAQKVYAEEFLRMLPPMPPAPLEPERVYDIPYDRRTMKKGEEPPYRYRTDAKGRPTTLDLEAFKDFLYRFVDSTADPTGTVAMFAATYADFVAALMAHVPAIESAAPQISVPLIDFAPNAGALVSNALAVFSSERVRRKQHFSTIREAFERNRTRASHDHLRDRDLAAGKALEPRNHPGGAREMLDAYLAGTPLHPLFVRPVPFALPLEKRFEGHWIIARQGAGKTNALECLINADLAEVMEGRASIVVIDSQGISADTLLGRLANLKLFGQGGALADRLIYLEPDLEYPLALNIFDIGLSDMGQLTAGQREDIVASACEVVEFLFTGLLGGELSDNMTMLYKYLVPAMLAIPGADMNTFIELLDTDAGRDRPIPAGFARYRQHFAKLEPEIRSFLETDFLKDFELLKTKAAVRRRLRAAMADTTFRRMFLQPHNKLNLFRELQSGKVVLVNTFPARNYVEPFGRLILALLMQATRQRLEIDRAARMPTYVYVDECQDYIANEERIARYIDKCRKQNVALIFANQRLSNIENPKVRNALSGMAIKFAGISDADNAELASLTMTEPDHIRHMSRGTFAAYVSGLTPHGIDLQFPLSPLKHAPRMARHEWDAMRAAMRRKYAVRYDAGVGERGGAAPPANNSDTRTQTIRELRPPTTEATAALEDDDYDPLK